MISDPIEFELFKRSLFSAAAEIPLNYLPHDLFERAEGQYGLFDRDVRRLGEAGGARLTELDPENETGG